jgi:hypothetical protein
MTTREAVELIIGYTQPAPDRMEPADKIRYYTGLGLVLELLMTTLSGTDLTEITALRDATDVLAGIATAEAAVETGFPYPAPA